MIREKLESVGIKVQKLRRKQSDPFIMELSANRKAIKIHEGKNAKINVKTNKTHKQAVLIVKEPERSWTESAHIFGYGDTVEEIAKSYGGLDNYVRANHTTAEGQIFSVENLETSEISQHEDSVKKWAKFDLRIIAPETEQYFLIGFDEEHCFISQLPEKPKSVTHAHKILRPEVSKDAIRVGEWFFDPVRDEKLVSKLIKSLTELYQHGVFYDRNVSWYEYDKTTGVEVGSDNHEALDFIRYKNQNYVFGIIYDTRGTHKPIVLNGWHRAVRNKEIVNLSEAWD